jgi:cation-transporting ATPase 13A1
LFVRFDPQSLDTLSKQRPLPSIFNAYSILTVTSQFAVHFASLLYLVQQAKAHSPARTEEFVDLAAEFKPSLLNSTVYVISMWLQVCTFAVNYHGHPFMQSLAENKSLLYSIGGSLSVLLAIVSGLAPDLADQFSIVPFEAGFQRILLFVLFLDFGLAFLADRFWQRLCGEGRLRRQLTL